MLKGFTKTIAKNRLEYPSFLNKIRRIANLCCLETKINLSEPLVKSNRMMNLTVPTQLLASVESFSEENDIYKKQPFNPKFHYEDSQK